MGLLPKIKIGLKKRARRGGEASTVGFFGRVYLITERFSLSAKIATKIKKTTP